MLHRLTAPLLLVLCASVAHATSADDLKVSIEPSDYTLFGIDDCASEAARDITISGSVANTPLGNYKVVLSWSTTGSACDQDTLSPCDMVARTDECGCLKEGDKATSLETTIKLTDLLPNVCSATDDVEIEFFLSYFPEQDEGGTVQDLTGGSVQVTVDLTRPKAPTNAPSVTAADGSLQVAFDEVTDAEKYDICYRQYRPETAAADAGATGATSNDDLEDGYTCETTGSTADYRIDASLDNDVTYEVVYAVFDDAGNRSPNSPPVRGAPTEVKDFAEYYHQAGGPELGGCGIAGSGRGSSGLWILASLLGGLGIARRRKA